MYKIDLTHILIAVLVLVGFIDFFYGLILFNTVDRYDQLIPNALKGSSAILSSLFIFALASIINLLDKIAKK